MGGVSRPVSRSSPATTLTSWGEGSRRIGRRVGRRVGRRGGRGGAGAGGRRRRELPDDLLVAELPEVVVPVAHGAEPWRRLEEHHVVGGVPQLLGAAGRPDRGGQDHAGRPARPGRLTGGPGGGSGGDTVVDHHDGAAGDRQRRPALAQHLRAAGDLADRDLLDGGVLLRADPGRADDGLVHDPRALLADRAHGQLGVAGDADLADDQDVQRGVQGLCHAHRDGDAPAGQAQDDGIGQAQLAQPLTQPPPGLVPVGKDLPARARSRPHPVTVARAVRRQAGALVPNRTPPPADR